MATPNDQPCKPHPAELVRARQDAGQRITCLTGYDYPTARLLDEAGVDFILVGDSLGMVVLGHEDTTSVTMKEMLHHTRAVARGVTTSMVIGDLPYCSYDTPGQAVQNARRLMDAGADCVKLEGGLSVLPQIQAIVADGIPLFGHVGMLPQKVREEGGYSKKGKTDEQAAAIREDAIALEQAGAFAIVLESMVPAVAKAITQDLKAASIGIGASKYCDGQILVIHDLLGSFPWFRPSFAKPRADLASETKRAVSEFIHAVRETGNPNHEARVPGASNRADL